jgi:hypothetical protein
MPKVIGRSQNTRRELKCQKIKRENVKNLTTKTRKGESTKRKRLKLAREEDGIQETEYRGKPNQKKTRISRRALKAAEQ